MENNVICVKWGTKFGPEYVNRLYKMVENDNLFVFADATDVHDIVNGRSGVILMGFPSNKWMNY